MNGKGDKWRQGADRASFRSNYSEIDFTGGDKMEKAVHRLRPSAASRWLNCPTSEYLSTHALPKSRSLGGQRAAAEGTCAHAVLEDCLLQKTSPMAFIGQQREVWDEEQMEFPMTFTVDMEMVEGVNMVLEYADDLIMDPYVHVQRHAEVHHQHSVVPALEGTSDIVQFVSDSTHMDIIDLKYGKGSVYAQSKMGVINPQLKCYIALMFDKYPEMQTAVGHIVQPRRTTKKKALSTRVVSREEAEVFMGRVLDVSAEIESQIALDAANLSSLQEGSHCFFCPVKGTCPIRIMNSLEKDFGPNGS